MRILQVYGNPEALEAAVEDTHLGAEGVRLPGNRRRSVSLVVPGGLLHMIALTPDDDPAHFLVGNTYDLVQFHDSAYLLPVETVALIRTRLR